MKKILVLVLTLYLLFVFCSCSKSKADNVNLPAEQETLKLPFATTDTIELYYSLTDSDSSEASSICMGDSKTVGIHSDTVEIVDDSVTKEKTVRINNKDINVTYQTTKKGLENEPSVFSQSIDIYALNNEKFEFLHNTNQLIGYYRSCDSSSESANHQYEEAELMTISQQFILEYLNQVEFSKYSFDSAVFSNTIKSWIVTYRRYVHEYTTDNYIWVWIEKDGSVSNFQLMEHGKYDYINPDITKEHIDAAVVAAETKLSELNLTDLEIRTKTLTTNTEGVLFVEIVYEYKTGENDNRLEKIYAKIG